VPTEPRYLDLAKQADPDNRLLWRRQPRRLEGELLRDAVLSASGTLDEQMFGAAQAVQVQGDGQVTTSSRRRSIYLINRRSQPMTLLNVFDTPVMELNCLKRPSSVVASQALEMLNSQFLLEQSDRFAGRLLSAASETRTEQAFRLTFGRPPTDSERQAITGFIADQTQRRGGAQAERKVWADVCQMLLCANEFIYVD
jgi:hypothetical protein